MGIDFKTNPLESLLLLQIARRAKELNPELDVLETEMDLTAVHLNGCPLRLEDMLKAKEFDFQHDIYGIRNCLDRRTGKLLNNFLPRFSK